VTNDRYIVVFGLRADAPREDLSPWYDSHLPEIYSASGSEGGQQHGPELAALRQRTKRSGRFIALAETGGADDGAPGRIVKLNPMTTRYDVELNDGRGHTRWQIRATRASASLRSRGNAPSGQHVVAKG
jgi:hypothetical protein